MTGHTGSKRVFCVALAVVCAVTGVASAAGQAVARSPAVVEIISPQPGETLQHDTLTVRYKQAAQSPPSPSFELRLDDREPVTTVGTETTFNRLTPGNHTLVIQEVDANNTPISGSRNVVHFSVTPQTPPEEQSPQSSPQKRPPRTAPLPSVQPKPVGLRTATAQGPNARYAEEQNLPSAASALPWLLIIGTGVLTGGLVSARRTRR
ncbi:MAG TPA: hypothetical protein VFK06_19260 [Candidatus Angelobacter sp.]|nr:hypothetical protein [Candidatus Angelobacter sp.]